MTNTCSQGFLSEELAHQPPGLAVGTSRILKYAPMGMLVAVDEAENTSRRSSSQKAEFVLSNVLLIISSAI